MNASMAQFVSSAISPLNSLVTYLTIGTVAVVGTMQILQGNITVGNLQAFIRYIWQVNDPLKSDFFTHLHRFRQHLRLWGVFWMY